MDRLEELRTQGAHGTERTASRRLAGAGSALLAFSGLTALALTGCPSSPANNDSDMGSLRDMGSGTDMNTVRPQQPGCSKDEWCWLNPQPQGNTLWTVWGSSASNAWAAGESGALVHYTGGQWKSELSPTKSPLYALWGSSENDIYAVGDRGTVLHYDGQAWSAMTISGSTTGIGALYGVWGSSKDDVWIVGAGGVILRKSGSTLSRVQTPMDPAYQVLLKGVWGTGSTVYAIGAAGSLQSTSGSVDIAKGLAIHADLDLASDLDATTVTSMANQQLAALKQDGRVQMFGLSSYLETVHFGNKKNTVVFDLRMTDQQLDDLITRLSGILKSAGLGF